MINNFSLNQVRLELEWKTLVKGVGKLLNSAANKIPMSFVLTSKVCIDFRKLHFSINPAWSCA